METFLIAHDSDLRIYAFFMGSLLLLWESGFPARVLIDPVISRWSCNISLFIFDIFLVRILLPVSSVGLAIHASNRGWGMLNLIDAPVRLEILLALLLLDATAYLFHVALHRIPLLWRIHAIHHCDKDFDCTTGLRFHPFEALAGFGVRLGAIAVLGIPVIAIVCFEVWAVLVGFYTHANIGIPSWIDRSVRKLLVTSNMHRIHHSAHPQDGMSNFGVVFSVWDRLFGTYRERSTVSGEGFPVGLPWFNIRPSLGMVRLIALPMRSAPFKEQTVGRNSPIQ